ncbi:MAG TPA: sulfatase-like hydrolase/transferase [Thermoanaerobaculia bacterium]|nr:sulfatase-like hydrolase/transferase [Thermoanaerobaculia bacterium]
MRRRPVADASLAALLLLALLLLPACSRKAKEPVVTLVTPGAPVILIVVDTLRSDRLPFYGHVAGVTPALSALREDSVLFESAWSHVPLTLPAHASLFTGTLPGVHRVLDNGGYRLGTTLPTLAEVLKGQGYETGGAISSIVLSGATGISRGFDFWEDRIEPDAPGLAANRVLRPGEETAKLLTGWLGRTKGDRRFAFLHVYEPHAPYEPPEPFRSRFADPYDGEVAAADAAVGAFLDELKRRGIYEKSLIVFLSDHGEGLGDHGEEEHGVFLYREAIQVPLLLKLPSTKAGERPPFAGSRVATPVQLVDVFPTIAKAVGVPGFVPAPGTLSLAGLAAGEPAPERRILAETFFPRIRFGWSELHSLVDGKWQYIEAPRPEFYDLGTDPGETKNLASEKPGPLRAMKVELEKRASAFVAPEAVDEEQAKKLASLGYLTMTSAAGGVLPDPKDEIETLQLLKQGLGLAKAGRVSESTEVLKRLLDRNPRIVDAWEVYAQGLVRLGRKDEALAAIRKTVELSPPDRTNYVISVANLCLQVGRPDEAVKNADLAIARGDTGGHEVKARAYLAMGDLAKAESEARRSIETGDARKRSWLVLASVEAGRGNFQGALQITDDLKAKVGERGLGDLIGFHFLRGNLLGRLNRWEEAEAELLQETRQFPQNLNGWQTLALVYANRARVPEAKKVVAAMVEAVGSPAAYAAAVELMTRMGDASGAAGMRADAVRRFPGLATGPGR